MVKQSRPVLAALLFALLLLQPGCLLLQARNAPPEVKYYAAVADFNVAKGIAAAYAESPSSDIEVIEKILDVATRGDTVIMTINHTRVNGDLSNLHFDLAAKQLTALSARLTRLAAERSGQ